MRKSRFTEAQIVAALKEVESGVPVADVVRNAGVSRASFFQWLSKCGGATMSELALRVPFRPQRRAGRSLPLYCLFAN